MISVDSPRNYFGPGGADVKSSGSVTTILRRIPLVPQRDVMSCWFAAATMVLGYAPSATLEMWDPPGRPKGSPPGGLDLASDVQLQKFVKMNGLILYPMSKWSLEGITERLRNRSAFFYPRGLHVVVVAGIEFNPRDPNSSKLIIYDPEPVGRGKKIEVRWGQFLAGWKDYRASTLKLAPESEEHWRKRGWFGTGTYFLHR